MYILSTKPHRFSSELRTKIEREFDENPLLKNLGLTIHGSVHDARQAKSSPEKKPTFAYSQPQPQVCTRDTYHSACHLYVHQLSVAAWASFAWLCMIHVAAS